MSKYSFRNYSSQEYSPGDTDPVSNHRVVEADDRGNITGRDRNMAVQAKGLMRVFISFQ